MCIFVALTFGVTDESPAYNVFDIDLFPLLEEDISIYRENGDIFIARDFNARLENRSDFIVHDDYNAICDEDNYVIEHSPLSEPHSIVFIIVTDFT